jgi:hypothetical protein
MKISTNLHKRLDLRELDSKLYKPVLLQPGFVSEKLQVSGTLTVAQK